MGAQKPPVRLKLEVSVVLDRGNRVAAGKAIEEERAVAHMPMLLHEHIGLLLHLLHKGRFGGAADAGRIEALLFRDTLPPREVEAVE